MNKDVKRNFYIIDFSAGNFITHHLNYVIAYAKFIKNFGYDYKIFVPKYLNQSELDKDFSFYKILSSRNYRLFPENFTLWLLYFRVIRITGYFGKIIESIVGRFIIFIYIHLSYKRILKIINNDEIEIIFPSTDFMAVLLLKKMLSNQVNVSKFYLRINAIDKNLIEPNLRIDALKILENLVESYPNIVIGCETKNLLDFLVSKNSKFINSVWIPLPSEFTSKNETSQNIYGFLGGAKKRKGFEEIPKWINKISKVDNSSLFLIQQSPFNWPGYLETISALQNTKNIELLPKVMSNNEFFHHIRRCTFIVTPYDSSSYHLVSSSLFYYASDMLIPTIAYDNLGFSYDIVEFGCGIVLADLNVDFNFSKVEKDKLTKKLILYNKFRNNQNKYFLNLFPAV